MAFTASVHAKVIDLVKLSLGMATAAGSGHPTSAASLAHLVTVLMYTHMRYEPACPDDLAADGPSQMALSDVAFFRALTTVRVQDGQALLYLLQPADAYAAYALTVAMAAHEGPCYLWTLRPDVPFLYNDVTAFSLGGHHVLTEGHDLCIIAVGYMVHEAPVRSKA